MTSRLDRLFGIIPAREHGASNMKVGVLRAREALWLGG
jgi:hypothetical protein